MIKTIKKTITVCVIFSVIIGFLSVGQSTFKKVFSFGAKAGAVLCFPQVIPSLMASYNINEPSSETSSEAKITTEDSSVPSEESTVVSHPIVSSVTNVKTGKIETTLLSLKTANTQREGVHISNKTGLSINVAELMKQGLPFEINDSTAPQVLIVHTHATESYTFGDYGYYIKDQSTRTTDNSKNVVRAGDVIADVLNKAGIVTINDGTQHDYPSYTGSYSRSAVTIKSYLEKYPSIKVVIDLHRDAITRDDSTKIKPTAEINGKKAAQIMLLCGAEVGDVSNFPNWKENLRFNLLLEKQLEADYPELCRPMSFKACKYNFDIINGSILVELGSEANTLEEALYSAELLGNALVKTLKS